MKLSSQEEYGLRCLLQLARQPDRSLAIPEIGLAEGISAHNVAKLLRILRQGSIVESERGQHGGYTLARPSHEITVGEVLAVLGGRLYEPGFCQNFSGIEKDCTHSSTQCSVRGLWHQLQHAVDEVLSRTTLHDLLHCGDGDYAPADTAATPGLLEITAADC